MEEREARADRWSLWSGGRGFATPPAPFALRRVLDFGGQRVRSRDRNASSGAGVISSDFLSFRAPGPRSPPPLFQPGLR